jgi:hypothetical protein
MNKINRQSLLDLITISHRLEGYSKKDIQEIQNHALRDPRGAVEMFSGMFAVLDDHQIPYRYEDGKIQFSPLVTRLLKGTTK